MISNGQSVKAKLFNTYNIWKLIRMNVQFHVDRNLVYNNLAPIRIRNMIEDEIREIA